MPETFTCALCGQTFAKAVGSEDEARAELARIFGAEVSTDDCDVLCDGCYHTLLAVLPHD